MSINSVLLIFLNFRSPINNSYIFSLKKFFKKIQSKQLYYQVLYVISCVHKNFKFKSENIKDHSGDSTDT